MNLSLTPLDCLPAVKEGKESETVCSDKVPSALVEPFAAM